MEAPGNRANLVPPPRPPATWRDWPGWPRRRALVRVLPWVCGVVLAAGIAVANLTQARINWNDVSAWSTLRTVASAQQQFRDAAIVDLDADGRGEYGSFAELSGAVALRGTARLLRPPVLSGAFRTLDSMGAVHRSGYRFRLYLRTTDGSWVGSDPLPVDVLTNAAETEFLCYAWPSAYGTSGRPTLVVDQTGVVLHTDDARYSGALPPPPGAAPRVAAALAGGPGPDGNVWTTGMPQH